jgi:hypothetical protein
MNLLVKLRRDRMTHHFSSHYMTTNTEGSRKDRSETNSNEYWNECTIN